MSHNYKGARDKKEGHGNYSSGNIFPSQFSIVVDILPKRNFSLKRPHSSTIVTQLFHMKDVIWDEDTKTFNRLLKKYDNNLMILKNQSFEENNLKKNNIYIYYS